MDVAALGGLYLKLQRSVHTDRHVNPSNELYEGRPDVDPLTIRVTDLLAWVMALPGFDEDSNRSREKFWKLFNRPGLKRRARSTLGLPSFTQTVGQEKCRFVLLATQAIMRALDYLGR